MQPPRLIFLDFDGVLNSEAWRTNRGPHDPAIDIATLDNTERYALRSLDPAAVQVLETIVRHLDARVVVSSSWRLDFSVSQLNWFLAYHGFTDVLLGATPDSTRWGVRGAGVSRTRSGEIAVWLGALGVWPVEYVILDDEPIGRDSGHGGHGDRLYKLDPMVGLRDADVDAIIARCQSVG